MKGLFLMPLFTDNHLQTYEREMQRIPNFGRRGGGSTVQKHFQHYTEEDCDCKLCLHYGGRKKRLPAYALLLY